MFDSRYRVLDVCKHAALIEDRDSNIATQIQGVACMKVRASVKKMCPKCKIIRRKGVVRVICENKRHKQRQG